MQYKIPDIVYCKIPDTWATGPLGAESPNRSSANLPRRLPRLPVVKLHQFTAQARVAEAPPPPRLKISRYDWRSPGEYLQALD